MIEATTETTISTLAGIAGMLAGIPAAALAFTTPQHRQRQAPQHWRPETLAPPRATLVTCLVTAATSSLACVHCHTPAALPAFWLTAVLGTTLATIDIRCHRLPHALTTIVWVACGISFLLDAIAWGDYRRVTVAIATAIATSGTLMIIALAFPGQLGLGDVNVAGAFALSLGWWHWSAPLVGLLVAFSLQAIVVAGLLIVGSRTHDDRDGFPLGPALLLGWLMAIWVIPGQG